LFYILYTLLTGSCDDVMKCAMFTSSFVYIDDNEIGAMKYDFIFRC